MERTTEYGSWNVLVDRYHSTVEDTVTAQLDGGPPEWQERMRSSGAFGRVCEDYRAAVEAALPPDVSLCGNAFFGPDFASEKSWDGELDITSLVEGIDLSAIIDAHDVVSE